MKKVERVSSVAEGFRFPIKYPNGTIGEVVVGPKCDSNNGQWYCVTHAEAFQNQLQKDTHIRERGKHLLSWICSKHGNEIP